MATIDWTALIIFVCAVEAAALYGLALSGHFPAEYRPETLRHGWGAALLWATALATAVSLCVVLLAAAPVIPWPVLVIGAGAMLLFAPLLLRPFPDAFVNGRRALLAFSAGTVVFAALLWWMT